MRESIVERAAVSAVLASLLIAIIFHLQAAPASAQSEETPEEPTPTATASPPDIALARELTDAGDTEGAIAAYRAYIDGGATASRPEALLNLAKLLINDGQAAGAARQLDIYLFEATEDDDVLDVQFLLAEALRESGNVDDALPLYEAYIAADGHALLYARVGRAKALATAGRPAEAEAEAEALLEEELPASIEIALTRAMAETFEAQDDTSRALAWYGRLTVAGSPVEQALALWRSALMKLPSGDESWRADILAIIQRYPSTHSALEAVHAFLELRGSIDDYYFGLVHYQHGEDDEARAIFDAILAGPSSPNAGRAAYYLAVIDERAGDVEAALAGYARVLDIAPNIELVDDALWWRGRLLESEGRQGEAARTFEQLATQFSGSERGREARFRLALMDFAAGEYGDAADAYASLAADTNGEDRQRALLWQGKALAESDDEEAAAAVWRQVQQDAGETYFGLRAGALLGEASGSLADGTVRESDEPDWAALARWVDEGEGRVATPTPAPVSVADTHLRLGRQLSALGLQGAADAEYELALEAAGGDPDELFGLVRQFQSLDLHHASARAAARLLTAVDEEDAQTAPDDLWRLAYPTPYLSQLMDATDESGAPPLLLLAMVRQESFFNPRAGSPAGAIGLTQVIEPTGEAIADELGVERFALDDLYQPALSLRFGAHYISDQIEAFDGNAYHALAAYNGGPGNAAGWADAAGGDIDWFFEEIDFAETRLYIKLVGENLGRYRFIYGDIDAPSLPVD